MTLQSGEFAGVSRQNNADRVPAVMTNPGALENRAHVPVSLGSGTGAKIYYCGRRLGVSAIPGC